MLPKPCLASISSGPPEHVIPQMVITSPDDNENPEEIPSEIATIPDILVSESPPCDYPDEENDLELHVKGSENNEFDNRLVASSDIFY